MKNEPNRMHNIMNKNRNYNIMSILPMPRFSKTRSVTEGWQGHARLCDTSFK